MKQIQMGSYQVKRNELVTIKVTPSIGAGNQFTAVLDNTELDRPADGKYSFRATNPVGQPPHFFNIEFGFLGAEAGAQYRMDINGDAADNEGPFTLTVVNGDPEPERQLSFEVVA